MRILMCRPDHYGVEYEINPWMHLTVPVDRELARHQWQALHDAYREYGVEVDVVPQVPGLPDMVFTANAGLVHDGTVVLSRFRYPQRRGEEPHWRRILEERGLRVCTLPEPLAFEGAGDALFVGERLFAGYGFRTDRAAHQHLERLLGVEVVSLRLVDPRFYHLDTCFCPLTPTAVLVAPGAFDRSSARLIRDLVPHVIDVPLEVAAGFACNAMPLDGRVVSSPGAAQLADELAALGFTTVTLPMSEFIKSGGGVRCLSLPLAS